MIVKNNRFACRGDDFLPAQIYLHYQDEFVLREGCIVGLLFLCFNGGSNFLFRLKNYMPIICQNIAVLFLIILMIARKSKKLIFTEPQSLNLNRQDRWNNDQNCLHMYHLNIL